SAESPPLAETTSDANGDFRIAWDPEWPEKLTVEAQAPGHLTKASEVAGPGLVGFVLSRIVLIRCRVLAAETDAPLAGAEVDGLTTGTTDTAGRCELTVESRSGYARLRVDHAGYLEYRRGLSILDSDPVDVDVRLRRLAMPTLQVVDAETGAPIAGALVFNTALGAAPKTDEHGQYRLTTGNGEYVSRVVIAAGYGSTEWTWLVRDASSTVPRIPLVRLATIEGRVTDSAGTPAVGARVDLVNSVDREYSPSAVVAAGPGTFSFSSESAPVETDAEGRFELRLLPSPTAASIRVRHEAMPPVCSAPFQLDRAGARMRIDLTLGAGGTIRGTARRNGKPMVDAQVSWQSATNTGLDGSTGLKPDGSYELLDVSPGEVCLRLGGRFETAQRCTLRVDAGATLQHDFVVEERRAPITGRITSSTGLPLANIAVQAFSDGAERHVRYAKSNSDGRYSIPCTAGYTYAVKVTREAAERRRAGVAAASHDIDFTMSDLGSLRLQLRDAENEAPCVFEEDAQPWTLAWRAVGDREFVQASRSIDSRGRIDLRLPVGAVDVSVWAAGSGHAPRTVLGLPVTVGADPPVIPIDVPRGVEVTVALAPDAPMPRDVCTGHLFLLLDDREAAMVRGPFAEASAESNHRINGVNMWFDEPGLLHRLVPFGGPHARPLRGLTPGRRRLRAFPDDIVFEPTAIDVTPAGGRFAVRWRRR
ncbi:MAG: carboxypeptidase regulatory-like domain-containing protein, partial [Planctomycetes bacterium]|nr:carboxypeptidase regulatory-like domain-containing protein [Planctomycetota bacterium]